jgi:hypothetical protein
MPRKRTHREYKELIALKYGTTYKILAKYINSKSHINFFCEKCRQNHTMSARHLLTNGCSGCGRKAGSAKNTLTNSKFKELLRSVHGERIINLDKYIKRNVKIRFYSYDCNHEWEATPDSVLSGNGCNVCSLERSIKTRIKKDEVFLKEMYDLVGNEYDLLEKYIKSDTQIMFKHNKCNKEFSMTPHSFLSGRRCPHCYGTPKKTSEQFKNEVLKLVGNEYEVLSEYSGNKVKVTFLHTNCKDGKSYIFGMKPNSFLSGQRCPNCSPSKKDTKESFEDKLLKTRGQEYKLLSQYINNSTKVLLIHTCGYKWLVAPNNILRGQDCPLCYKMQGASKGERRIIKHLNEREIDYTIEVTFPDLKNKKKLRFDIGAIINNKVVLIEFHGIQHYEPVDFFGGKNTFKNRKRMDELKVRFAKERGIPLIIIPYWDYENIERILETGLNR